MNSRKLESQMSKKRPRNRCGEAFHCCHRLDLQEVQSYEETSIKVILVEMQETRATCVTNHALKNMQLGSESPNSSQ
jgi:hypothetical protein